MSDHDFDYIEREIKRIERDIKLARGYSARDHLNTIPSAVEAAASIQRAVAGLDHKKLSSAVRAASAPKASLGGVGAYGSVIRDVLRSADEARSAVRSARVINPGSFGAGMASHAAMAMDIPISASRQIAGVEKAMKAAMGARSIVEAARIDTSAMREAMGAATSARSIFSEYSAAHASLAGARRQQDLFYDILKSAKRQGTLGRDVKARFLSGGPVRTSAAFRSTIGAATSYGPIVVTPDAPPPPPRQKPSSHYTPNLQANSVIPYTAADPNDKASFDAVWVVVMAYAHAIAQHRGTRVIVRFVGDNKDQIVVGIVSGIATNIIWLLITLI